MHFKRKFNQLIDQFAEGYAAGFPEFRIHADGSETGNGVDFVQKELAAFFLQEEIHASHSGEFQRPKRVDSESLDFLRLRGLQISGNHQLRAFLEILRGVVVEFAVRHDFAGDGSLGS